MISSNLIKKFRLPFLLLFIGTSAFSQGNLPYADGRFVHLGFFLGTNLMDFNVLPTSNDSVRASALTPGFSVGAIGDMRINKYLNLRFTPGLHFGTRKLDYSFSSGNESTSVNSVFVCIPAYLKYSAERYHNYRPYLIGGGGIYIDLGTDDTKPIVLKPFNVFTEFGVGCDLYFSYFKLSPELKFAIGFNDIYKPYVNPDPLNSPDAVKQMFNSPISKLTTKMLTLSFNFE